MKKLFWWFFGASRLTWNLPKPTSEKSKILYLSLQRLANYENKPKIYFCDIVYLSYYETVCEFGRAYIFYFDILNFPVGPPYTLRLKVKFYSSEPNTLREELTRYQFFLQLKHDILTGRLECLEEQLIELCALALQCKKTMIYTFTVIYLSYIEKKTSKKCKP